MSGFSDYLENLVIENHLRTTPVYVTIHTVDPTDAGTNPGITRVACNFAVPSNGVTSNTADVTFSSVAAGTYTHASIWDAASGGNMLYSGSLQTAKTADAGDNLSFAIGELTVTNS